MLFLCIAWIMEDLLGKNNIYLLNVFFHWCQETLQANHNLKTYKDCILAPIIQHY